MITIRHKFFITRYLFGILLLLSLFSFSNAMAQNGVVKGTVKDKKGDPLPGVTIQVKGTNNSTSTTVDGSFSITAAKGSVLQVRFIGYQAFDATVGDAARIDITLTESQTTLNDVVVVGYGTSSKKELTSAITTVKAENFNAGVVATPADL
ncbi:MAG: carboxypeptidase-like regulatory domain-containing protein, partial [Mucilaginibacter sp.]